MKKVSNDKKEVKENEQDLTTEIIAGVGVSMILPENDESQLRIQDPVIEVIEEKKQAKQEQALRVNNAEMKTPTISVMKGTTLTMGSELRGAN